MFGRRGGSEPEPVVAGPGDVRRLAALLDQFELAVGRDGPVRRAATAIAHAGGFTTFLDLVMSQGDPDRPWKWLAAVAERAAGEGELTITGRVYLFVDFWIGTVAPLLEPSDWMELGLERPEPATEVRLAVAGFEALRRLPGREVLVDHPSGVITVATMTISAAVRIVTLGEAKPEVDATVVADARQWLDAFRKS